MNPGLDDYAFRMVQAEKELEWADKQLALLDQLEKGEEMEGNGEIRCRKCKRVLPATNEHFPMWGKSLSHVCKDCKGKKKSVSPKGNNHPPVDPLVVPTELVTGIKLMQKRIAGEILAAVREVVEKYA